MDADWTYVRDAALATSSVSPSASLPRRLARQLAVSGFRVAAIPRENGGSTTSSNSSPIGMDCRPAKPDPHRSTFLNVDGGVFNNEPLRTGSDGACRLPTARNARKARFKADRAVIMIDPFSDAETLSRPDRGKPCEQWTASIVTSLIQQAQLQARGHRPGIRRECLQQVPDRPGRDPDPNNKRTVGQRAIASGALGSFAGLVDPSFLAYDFSLGRLNAHKFLAEHLALPVTLPPEAARPHDPNNPIFNDWTKDQFTEYALENRQDPQDTQTYLPIIPLMPSLRADPPQLHRLARLGPLRTTSGERNPGTAAIGL